MNGRGCRSGASPLRELCGGNLELGLLYFRPWRICRKGDGHLSIGPRWGTWKGGSIPGTLREE